MTQAIKIGGIGSIVRYYRNGDTETKRYGIVRRMAASGIFIEETNAEGVPKPDIAIDHVPQDSIVKWRKLEQVESTETETQQG